MIQTRPDQTHTFVVIVAAATEDLADRVMTERLDPDEDYGFPYTIPNWIRVPEDNPHTCIFDDTFRCLACEIKQAYGLDENHTSPKNATVTLPMKIVLGWFMASDPTPLKPEEDAAIRELLDARSKELGFEGGWIEAFHKIDQFDPSTLLPDVNAAVAALNNMVMTVKDRKQQVPGWLWKAIEDADVLVNNIQDGINDPLNTGTDPEDQIYALNTYDPAGSGKPIRATHWYYQAADGWMAVFGEDEAAWFEDHEDGSHSQDWPNPRVYPITQRPPWGELRYRKHDGTDATEQVVISDAAWDALPASVRNRLDPGSAE